MLGVDERRGGHRRVGTGATATASRRCWNCWQARWSQTKAACCATAPCAWACWDRPTRSIPLPRCAGMICPRQSGAGRRARIRHHCRVGDIPWDAGGNAVGRAAPSSGPRAAAHRRLGRAGAGRAHEPSGCARYHVAGGPSKTRWKKGAGALLVVTHDRWFLDEVCLRMWEVHDKRVEPFEGGFSAHIMQRVERDRVAALAEQKRQNELRRELAWLARRTGARRNVPRGRRPGTHRRRAAFARRAGAQAAMAYGAPGQVVDLEHVSVRFDDKTILDDVDWIIGPKTATASSARAARARPRCCA